MIQQNAIFLQMGQEYLKESRPQVEANQRQVEANQRQVEANQRQLDEMKQQMETFKQQVGGFVGRDSDEKTVSSEFKRRSSPSLWQQPSPVVVAGAASSAPERQQPEFT